MMKCMYAFRSERGREQCTGGRLDEAASACLSDIREYLVSEPVGCQQVVHGLHHPAATQVQARVCHLQGIGRWKMGGTMIRAYSRQRCRNKPLVPTQAGVRHSAAHWSDPHGSNSVRSSTVRSRSRAGPHGAQKRAGSMSLGQPSSVQRTPTLAASRRDTSFRSSRTSTAVSVAAHNGGGEAVSNSRALHRLTEHAAMHPAGRGGQPCGPADWEQVPAQHASTTFPPAMRAGALKRAQPSTRSRPCSCCTSILPVREAGKQTGRNGCNLSQKGGAQAGQAERQERRGVTSRQFAELVEQS